MAIGKVDGKDLKPSSDVSGGFAAQRTEEERKRFEENRAAQIQAQREADEKKRREKGG